MHLIIAAKLGRLGITSVKPSELVSELADGRRSIRIDDIIVQERSLFHKANLFVPPT